jgi:hypothetical protein
MLKYYVYISATKVDMLYPQIPPAFLKGAEAELKISLGVISSGLKTHGPEEAKELPARAAAVESYLRNQREVGTIDDPKSWLGGVALMRWGCVQEYASDIAFFGGQAGGRTVALLGSSDSIVGAPKVAESNHAPFYYTMKFFNQKLLNRGFKAPGKWDKPREDSEGEPAYYSYAESVDIAFQSLAGTEANLEFLAFVLYKEENLIVATPLYVALCQ